MSRLLNRPIAVTSWNGDDPVAFTDTDCFHVIVSVIDRWWEMGEWWNDEHTRRVLRVLTADDSLFDLEEQSGQWIVYRIWD